MKLTRNDLFIMIDREGPDLLADWRWRIGSSAVLFLASSLGDGFVQAPDGIYWLNVGDGSYTKIANDIAEFQAHLSTPELLDEWFIPQLVGDILATGVTRLSNQCFGFKTPPVLGGEYQPKNFEPTDLGVHFSTLGQIYKKVKDLPDGTKLKKVSFE